MASVCLHRRALVATETLETMLSYDGAFVPSQLRVRMKPRLIVAFEKYSIFKASLVYIYCSIVSLFGSLFQL